MAENPVEFNNCGFEVFLEDIDHHIVCAGAQRIIVELSGKLTALFDGDAGPLPVAGNGDAVYDEATAALVMLGFPKAASDKVVRAILKEQPDISVEETVRMSLKRL